MTQQKPEKEKCNFVTEVGMISFPALFPGQAEDSQRAGSKAYKCEFITDDPGQSLINAVSYVAAFYDSAQINPQTGAPHWHRHVFGPLGRLKKLEEYPRRNPAVYSYAINKYVIGVSKVVSLKGLKMEGANLSDPLVRNEYDRRVGAAAPKVSKFLSLHDPADIAWVAEENQRRQFANMAPLTEADIPRTTRPCRPDEIWPGCKVRIYGRAYWDANVHKTVLLALEQVLLIAQGDRLVGGEQSPDDVFGAFAPAADLAPGYAPVTGLALPAPQPVVVNPYGTPQPGYAMPQPVQFAPPAPPAPPRQDDPWANLR
jgi:hypothetical protein